MIWDWHDAALVVAGVIGSGVAIVHGVLTQRLVVGPLRQLAGARLPPTVLRLLAGLMQFSTFNWFLGGLALIVAAGFLDAEARLVAAVLVGSSYLFGAVGNFWATRGRHPGWALYTVALLLIAYGV